VEEQLRMVRQSLDDLPELEIPDDWRVSAIKTYLRLGFEPHHPDDSHHER